MKYAIVESQCLSSQHVHLLQHLSSVQPPTASRSLKGSGAPRRGSLDIPEPACAGWLGIHSASASLDCINIYIYIYISLAVKTHVCKHYCGFSDCCCRTTAIRLSFCGLLREQKHQNEETSPQTSKPSARERRGVNIASAKNPRLLQGSDGSSCGGSNDGSDAAIAAAITATTAAAAAAAMRVVIATTMTTSTATVAKTATTSATKTHKTSAARKASASEGKDASARATAAAAINHAAHSLLNVKRYQSSCGTK